nr:N-acetylmuramic acid 6-phosphate etherase [Ktedonosporobacter rubrisoli]
MPPTFNTPPGQVIGKIAGGYQALLNAVEHMEDSEEAGYTDAAQLAVEEKDAVVGITASGRTPYVLGALAYAREKNALTIGLACNKATPLEKAVEIMIAPVVGPEVITGSTRLKAGTAQKMVLNMLSTGTMILLGKTFGNLMVDLRATNYKLQQRSIKIVQQATGVSKEEADALLQATGGEVKTAIVVSHTHLTAEQARQELAAHEGSLRQALKKAGYKQNSRRNQ